MKIPNWLKSLRPIYPSSRSGKTAQFTYALIGDRMIRGELFAVKADDSVRDLLRAEVKAVNYSGQPGVGGAPPEGHGGPYFVKCFRGGLASIPFKDRERTMIILRTFG